MSRIWECVIPFKVGDKSVYIRDEAQYLGVGCNGAALVKIKGKEFKGKVKMYDFTQKFFEGRKVEDPSDI